MTGKRRDRRAEQREAERRLRAQMQEYDYLVNRAIGLVSGDEADEIVGEESEEHKAIVRAAPALIGTLWGVALRKEIKTDDEAQKLWAQAAAIAADLAHRAYALGVREGREGSE